MLELNLPKAEIKLENRNGMPSIWDHVRKKWLQLTPEEYVRQHFIHFLISTHKYPASMISVEKGLDVLRLAKRTDIVVYDNSGAPFLLIECKAPQVTIDQWTLEQVSAYNLTLKAPYVAVTNGLRHYFFKIDFEKTTSLRMEHPPVYGQ
jgi:hypothetical protein